MKRARQSLKMKLKSDLSNSIRSKIPYNIKIMIIISPFK